MAEDGSGSALKHLRRLARVGAVGGLTDGELLQRFGSGDGEDAEAAFGVLVLRHGPMVLRVCRTLLGDAHEAEDAFQATFLVLARRARSVRSPEQLGNWLYGVAHRTARKARAQALSRRSREVREDAMSPLEAADRGDRHDLALLHREQAGLIHEELERLPEKQRAVVVLCCLEGLKIEETARRLRCSADAVRGRLAQARSRLRDRLVRRGIAVPSAILASVLSAQATAATLSPNLKEATTRAALDFVGHATVTGAASAVAEATARRVSGSMTLSELKVPALALLALTAVGATAWTYRMPQPGQANFPATAQGVRLTNPRQFIEGLDWILATVNPNQGTIALQAGKGQAGPQAISIIPFGDLLMASGLSLGGIRIAPDARIDLDGQPANLKRLRAGMQVHVELAPGRLAVARLRARSDSSRSLFVQTVEAVDTAERTLSFSIPEPPVRLDNVRVAPDAEILRFHARPNDTVRFSKLDLKDLRPGMPASISLGVGQDGQLHVSSMYCAVNDGKGESP